MFYRFVVGAEGVFSAVERQCPYYDYRRGAKPEESWLRNVGRQYPDAKAWWTNPGLDRYVNSGLLAWHRSVVSDDISVLLGEDAEPVYEDQHQILCPTRGIHVYSKQQLGIFLKNHYPGRMHVARYEPEAVRRAS